MIPFVNPMMLGGAKKLRPQDVFATTARDGTEDGSPRKVSIGFTPKLLWTKLRNEGANNLLFSPSRTQGPNDSYLVSDIAEKELNDGADYISYQSDGYTVEYPALGLNYPGGKYVDWAFKEADSFYKEILIQHTTGTASAIDLPSFGPIGMVISKNLSASGNWPVWHRSLTAGRGLRLNLTAAQNTTQAWISVSGQTVTLSGSAPTGTYVFYIFAHNPDLIDCGGYAGNSSSSNGPSIVCGSGWIPQWLLFKCVGQTSDWSIFDVARGIPTGTGDLALQANRADAERSTNWVDLLPNGFKLTSSATEVNNSGGYIYMAIRAPV